MIFRMIYILSISLLINSSNFGQENNKNISSQSLTVIDSIPFILTDHNNISIQAIINEVDTVQLMLHTAANSVSITKTGMKNISSISLEGSENIKSWGGNSSSKFSTNNSIQIGEIINQNLTIWENKNSGPNTDGKFGLDLFEGLILEINFDEGMIFFYEKWNDTLAVKYGYEKLEVTLESGLLFIYGKSLFNEKQVISKFLVHSGFGGSILFDDQTTEKYQFSDNLKIIKESQLKDSFGNIIKTKKAILPDFILANQKFTNVPIGFFEGSIGRQKMSVLGGDILKRFNIIFDLRNTNVYLKPNSLMKTAFTDI
jgi:hypothetical protein